MKIIKPSVEIMDVFDGLDVIRKLELCGRVCYKSENKITDDSAYKFIENIINRGHESVLEHFSFSVKFICDRGVSHEIVRHRIASYSQESTRYCNYSKGDFNGEITVIEPCFLVPGTAGYNLWERACQMAEQYYFSMLDWGCSPEEARAVLPNSLKTEIVMTANVREWRHFLKLRTSPAAHPQMKEVAGLLLKELKVKIPVVFDDIGGAVRWVTRYLSPEEVQSLAQAKADGRLVVLPCKVGDNVYFLLQELDGEWYISSPIRITEIGTRGFWTSAFPVEKPNAMDDFTSWSELGKTVFLTKEEAEKALEVRE